MHKFQRRLLYNKNTCYRDTKSPKVCKKSEYQVSHLNYLGYYSHHLKNSQKTQVEEVKESKTFVISITIFLISIITYPMVANISKNLVLLEQKMQ